MKNIFKKVSLWILFFSILIIVLIIVKTKYMPHIVAPKASKIQVTPEELYDQYNKNEDALKQKLSGNIIEINGTVTAVDKSADNITVVMLGSPDKKLEHLKEIKASTLPPLDALEESSHLDHFNDVKSLASIPDISASLSDTRLTMDEDQENLTILLTQGDEITADCTDAEFVTNVPFLSHCSFQSIQMPLYQNELSLNKIYSNYNGKRFNAYFNISFPSTTGKGLYQVAIGSNMDCQSKHITLTDVITKLEDQNGNKKYINDATLNPNNPEDKKITDDGNKLEKTLEKMLNSGILSQPLSSYINTVCSL